MQDSAEIIASIPRTLPEFVLGQLRAAILQGRFVPGQRLDQGELARELGVSRIPVREALRTLDAEGLVELNPHHGAVVAELRAEEVEEVFIIRSLLEGMAARLAASRLTSDDRGRIQAALRDLKGRAGDIDDWLAHHNEFHMAVYEAARRPRLLDLIRGLRNTVQPYIRTYIQSPEHVEIADRGHEAILQACLAGDPDEAERATKQHLEEVWNEILSPSAEASGLSGPVTAGS